MTTPTPGQPLSEADVLLLQPGDLYLRSGAVCRHVGVCADEDGPYGLTGVYLSDDGFFHNAAIHRRFTFLGRPDQDGWIWHAGGDNPAPGLDVDVLSSPPGLIWDMGRGNDWSRPCFWRPHAPVSRPGDGVDFTSVDGLWKDQRLSRLERVKAHRIQFGSSLKQAVEAIDEESSRQSLAALTPPSEPVSRPAGEGEREAVARLIRERIGRDFDGECHLTEGEAYRILALLSPAAPDAGGGDRVRVAKALRKGINRLRGRSDSHTIKDREFMRTVLEEVEARSALQPGGER